MYVKQEKRICKCGRQYKTPVYNQIARYKKCTKCRNNPPRTIKDKSIKQLTKLAEKAFNDFIRERDKLTDTTFFCPTCGKIKRIEGGNYHACHLFPAGHYPALKFNEDNVFGGCQSCNYYKHGVGYEYAEWVRKHIGEERWNHLLLLKDYWKRNQWKWEKPYLIEIINNYGTNRKNTDTNTDGVSENNTGETEE